MAGYQHVIATLWQVSDLTAVDIPRHLYDQIIIERYGIIQIDADSAASALRKAVLAVRDGSPGLPAIYWAPYVHTGP
jgi:CHAT domain-containing protein